MKTQRKDAQVNTPAERPKHLQIATSETYKVVSLFSGCGGMDLGFQGDFTANGEYYESNPFEVIWANEINSAACRTYRHNIGDHIFEGDVWDNIDNLPTSTDVIIGGFPCQDISVAGNQAGIEGKRSGLWSECARLIGELRPRYAIFENVTNLLNGDGGDWFKRVLWDISSVGYDAEWHCIPASAIGAYHHRDRVWIVAYPSECKWRSGAEKQRVLRALQENGAIDNYTGRRGEAYPANISDPSSKGLQGGKKAGNNGKDRQKPRNQLITGLGGVQGGIWEIEPNVGRVANGIPKRSHRLKCLGNAVVPQIPEIIGNTLIKEVKDGRSYS